MKYLVSICIIIFGLFVTTELFAQPDTIETQVQAVENTVIQSTPTPISGFNLVSLGRGILGMSVLILLGVLLSYDRKSINWKLVAVGLSLQLILALGVLYVPFIGQFFEFLGKIFVKIMDSAKSGTKFLLGDLVNTEKYGFIFLFQTLPVIIFFSALMSLLYYWGIVQKLVAGLAFVLKKIMRISGAEGLSVGGSIFLGLVETPLLIKRFLPTMNKSEIFLVMTAGMAHISGGIMGVYIEMLGGGDPASKLLFAKHLISASVMAAPGAIVFAKIILPQTEKISDSIDIPGKSAGKNFLDAIANGTSEGVKMMINVAAMLLVFISFVTLINYILGDVIGNHTNLNAWVGSFTNGQFTTFNLQFILGMAFTPIMWLIGIAKEDMSLVGTLLGEKMIMNELIAFVDMNMMKNSGAFLNEKSIIMSTYILCGFANIGSIGMQIGGIGAIAPGTREWLTKYGIKAMLAGTLASVMSATIIGMIIG